MRSFSQNEDHGKMLVGFMEFLSRTFDHNKLAVLMPQSLGLDNEKK